VSGPVLDARSLRVELADGAAVIAGVDLRIEPGEILGLVGESGSGKTTAALSIFGYHTEGLKRTSGEISVAGEELRAKKEFRGARGRLVSYVPQNPGTALNPAIRVADTIEDMVRSGRGSASPATTSSAVATRTSCRAGSSSGSASPRRWRRIRRSWCWTSRRPGST